MNVYHASKHVKLTIRNVEWDELPLHVQDGLIALSRRRDSYATCQNLFFTPAGWSSAKPLIPTSSRWLKTPNVRR